MRNIRLVPGALLLSLTMLAGGWTVSASADEVKDRIMVTGEGTATIAPDMALLGLTVARQATTAREALDANSAAMAEVLAAMNEGLPSCAGVALGVDRLVMLALQIKNIADVMAFPSDRA